MGKDEEIREECSSLVLSTLKRANSLPQESEEFKKALEDSKKAQSMYLELAKADSEYDEAYQKRVEEFRKRQADNEFREKQLAQQHKEFRQKLVADCISNGVKIGFLAVVGKWSAALEGVSNISASTTKNLIREAWKHCFDFRFK